MRSGLGLDPSGYATDDDLMEVTFGQWEGYTLDELAARFPKLVEKRARDKWNFLAPGGESYAVAVERIRGFLARLDAPSVIVTHGGIIRGTRHLLEGIEGDTAVRGHVPQDNIYRFDGARASWIR